MRACLLELRQGAMSVSCHVLVEHPELDLGGCRQFPAIAAMACYCYALSHLAYNLAVEVVQHHELWICGGVRLTVPFQEPSAERDAFASGFTPQVRAPVRRRKAVT